MHIPVRIVLVETSHPGNVGATARAMKTMGLDELVLVAPRDFPSAEATSRASGADDVLARARIVNSLPDAIADCGFVAGASARLRRLAWPAVDPRGCAEDLWGHAARAPVAVVFGPEHSGMTNEDLGRCNRLVHIPANPEYNSLNVAMAVQVLCYELRMAGLARRRAGAGGLPPAGDAQAAQGEMPGHQPGTFASRAEADAPPATAAQLEGFHAHLEKALLDAGFLKPERSKLMKLRLRRIFQRGGLDRDEVNILRGALTALADGTKLAG